MTVRVMEIAGVPPELCPPAECPHCGVNLVVEGARPACPNWTCSRRIYGRLRKFTEVLDIKGAGEETLRQLAESKTCTVPSDLYGVTLDQFLECDRKGRKAYDKFVAGLGARSVISVAEFFASLGIEGLLTWEAITAVPGLQGIDGILDAAEHDPEFFAAAVRVSPEKARAIARELLDHSEEISRLRSRVKLKQAGVALMGEVFCITGRLSEDRRLIEGKIKDLGGRVSGSVTAETTYLVTNDPDPSSKKGRRAAELRVSVIDEVQLRDMLKA